VKPDAYFQLPSVTHYLVFEPDERELPHWRRGSFTPEHPPIAPLTFDPPGPTIDLAAIYDRAGVG
jgi:hypothetical protein